jgi:NADPH-dependent 7-cyano-7-deazaguanine reductase QueF
MVESKSLKLYLNSYNNERLVSPEAVRALIETDLSAACQSGVRVELHARPMRCRPSSATADGESIDAQELAFDRYLPDPSTLSADGPAVDECLRSDLLKTNCPVTLQPDWASLMVRYRGEKDRSGRAAALRRVLPQPRGLSRALRGTHLHGPDAVLPAGTADGVRLLHASRRARHQSLAQQLRGAG